MPIFRGLLVLRRSAPDAHFRGSLDVAVDTQQDALELVADFVLEKCVQRQVLLSHLHTKIKSKKNERAPGPPQ
jgi:hypothetical protein